ncbi:MAG: DUF2304 domain-containing protein, partial [Actinomycetota bacterium]|nr:DUF2304 domain-containing protein [Actinomycetota bacterium]
LAFLALLVVCIQLSLELSRLEETTRTVAEEVALLRLDVDQRLDGWEGRTRRPSGAREQDGPVT